MTPEQQRIAIAEACGWKLVNYGPPGYKKLYWQVVRPDGTIREHGMTGESFARSTFSLMVPNYTGDLNAMHEAEKSIRDIQASWAHYVTTLRARNKDGYDGAIHATAAQRAEAFLRTLNLWTV